MFLQGVGNHNQKLRQTFTFAAQNASGTTLEVELEYVAPDTLNEEHKQNQSRIIGERKYNVLQDLNNEAIELLRAYNASLAARVVRIKGVTLKKLSELLSMNVAKLREMGAKPSDEVPFDPADTSPINEEERKRFGVPAELQTKGQQATANILYLLQGNHLFHRFVLQTCQDVSYFQNEDWWGEDQLKNSGSGADTSSAPL